MAGKGSIGAFRFKPKSGPAPHKAAPPVLHKQTPVGRMKEMAMPQATKVMKTAPKVHMPVHGARKK